jgi:endonuclease YncB( thermonuclease family)
LSIGAYSSLASELPRQQYVNHHRGVRVRARDALPQPLDCGALRFKFAPSAVALNLSGYLVTLLPAEPRPLRLEARRASHNPLLTNHCRTCAESIYCTQHQYKHSYPPFASMTPTIATLVCLVIGIADGDTLTARCEQAGGAVNVKVRLAEIDAPERGQAFGTRSRQHLADLCFRKPATVRVTARDRYGRTVAHVECAGTDANAEQLRAGMAWVFARYVTDQSLYSLQDQARADQRGLWVDSEKAVPPWQWRRRTATLEHK